MKRALEVPIPPGLAPWIAVIAVTAIAAVIDLRTGKIPNRLSLPSMLCALLWSALAEYSLNLSAAAQPVSLLSSLSGAGLGFALMLCIAIAAQGGGGDVKLAAAIGAFTGPREVFIILGATCFAAVIGTVLLLVVRDGAGSAWRQLTPSRRRSQNSDRHDGGQESAPALKVPLGPYFLAGTVIAALMAVANP